MMDYQLDKKIVVLGAAKAFPVEDLPGAVLDNGRLSHLMAQVRDNLLRGPHPVNIEISDPEFPYERVGIRTVCVKDGVFLVNGMPIKLRGVNRHDFHPDRGAAVTEEDMRFSLQQMKEHGKFRNNVKDQIFILTGKLTENP